MTSFLYGRLHGKGKEQTATSTRDEPIRAQVETREAAIRVTLRADGHANIEIAKKVHDKDRPNRWTSLGDIDINRATGDNIVVDGAGRIVTTV